MLKVILFDLDGTLIDNDASEKLALEKLLRKRMLLKTFNVESFYNTWKTKSFEFFELYLSGAINFYEQRILKVQAVLKEYNLYADKEMTLDILDDFSIQYESSFILYEDVIDCLNYCSSEYILGIISNGDSQQQRSKLINTGIYSYFTSILISGDIGIAKPDCEIFNRSLEMVGVEHSEAVYIGDDPHKDIVGAQNAGIKSILIDRTSEFYSMDRINSLSCLKNLLNSETF